MTRQELIDLLAEKMMVESRGYEKGKWPIEWDKNIEDSQISMLIEDIEFLLAALDEVGYQVPTPSTSNGASYYTYSYRTDGTTATTTTGTATTVYPPLINEAEGTEVDVTIRLRTRTNPSLSEIKEFLDRANDLGLPLETEVIGNLQLTVSVKDSVVDQITCGDCGAQDYIVTKHVCNC